MKPHALVLGSRDHEAFPPMNLGDVAHMHGLRRLLREKGFTVENATWKAFPFFTFEKLCAMHDLQAVEREAKRVGQRSTSKATWIEAQLERLIKSPALMGNRVGRAIERRSHANTGITLTGYGLPRALRNLHARRFAQQVQNATVVVFNAGGLMAEHLLPYLPAHLLEVEVALKLGKPVCFVNYSLSLRNERAVALFRSVARRAMLHITREPRSAEALSGFGVPMDRIVSSVDAAFLSEDSSFEEAREILEQEKIPRGAMGLTIRGDRPVRVTDCVTLINALKRKFDRPIWFLDTCRAQDDWVFKKLNSACNLKRLRHQLRPPVLVRLLDWFDVVISDRYHGAVFCLLAGCPIIPIESTTWKTRGLFSMFDYDVPVLNWSPDVRLICDFAARALADRALLGSQLTRGADEMRRRLRRDYERLPEALAEFTGNRPNASRWIRDSSMGTDLGGLDG